jgi:ketosteroid isomerase-like protein
MYAGAVTRNPDAIAAMFTEDGVFDAPLAPDGHPLHRRLVGREAIRAGISVYHQQPAYQAAVNLARSTSVLHDTTDPDVFIAETDVAFDEPDGRRTTMALLRIFRIRDGQIAMLRDYFSELPSVAYDDHPG